MRWEVSKLEAVLDMYQPKTISQKEMVEDGKYPVFGANGQIGWHNDFNHEKPEVLLTCRGATCGFLNWSLPNSWINGNAMVMRPKDSSKLSREFLFKALAGGVDTTKAITGAAQPQITRKSLNPLCIPIPPLEEQERIVEILDEAFAAIDKAKANIERNLTNARELFQSRLNEIFSNPSEDWESKPLGEVCDFVRGPFGGSLKKNCFVESGYAVYEQKHPIHGDFSSFRYFINSDKFEEMRRFEVEPGNVLMSCSGTIGRTQVVSEGAPKGIINQALLNLKPKEGLAPLFLKKWMESIDFLFQIEQRSAGAALKNVASVKILKTIELRIPPFGEQVQVCEKLDEFGAMTKALEAQYHSELDNLDELRQSILEQAFAGKLTAEFAEA
jgi:type I restriction enzyme S subunit